MTSEDSLIMYLQAKQYVTPSCSFSSCSCQDGTNGSCHPYPCMPSNLQSTKFIKENFSRNAKKFRRYNNTTYRQGIVEDNSTRQNLKVLKRSDLRSIPALTFFPFGSDPFDRTMSQLGYRRFNSIQIK